MPLLGIRMVNLSNDDPELSSTDLTARILSLIEVILRTLYIIWFVFMYFLLMNILRFFVAKKREINKIRKLSWKNIGILSGLVLVSLLFLEEQIMSYVITIMLYIYQS